VISPKLVEVGRHLNIELLTNTELIDLEGEQGNFTAHIKENPRYIDVSKMHQLRRVYQGMPRGFSQ